MQSLSFNPAYPPLLRLGFDEEGRRRIGEKEIWERWVDRWEAPIFSGKQRPRFPSSRGFDFLAGRGSSSNGWRVISGERRFYVDSSLVGRFGVFTMVALVISVVCVLAVLWTSGRVCESLVGFVNLGLINSGDNWCLLLFWPEVNWVWNSSEPTGKEEWPESVLAGSWLGVELWWTHRWGGVTGEREREREREIHKTIKQY